MLNDKILEYFTALDNLTWYQTRGDSNLVLFPLLGLFGVCLCLTLLLIAGVIAKALKVLKKDKYINEIYIDDKRGDYVMSRWFIKRPLVTFILTIVFAIFFTGLVKYVNYTGEIKSDLSDLKGEIISGVMEDYLEGYTGDIVKSQDIFSATEIEKETLVKTSFKVDGVQYNNKFVYITYSPNYETDTLIPFDASKYPELIPTKEQREAPGRYGVIGDREKGFKLKGYSQNAVYIDDVHFIYNIKIND